MSSFVKAQIAGAAQMVGNTMGAATKDFNEGIASFITGERADTYDVKPVEEIEPEKKEAQATEREGFLDTGMAQHQAAAAQQDAMAQQQTTAAQQSQETDNDYGR